MKILYAAGNFTSSKYQLYQFVKYLPDCQLKISGYQNHIPFNIDFTLDFLHDYKNNHSNIFKNKNLQKYADQINKFKPDLIISDLCIYSSIIAIELNIPLWQYSPYLLLWSHESSIKLSHVNFNVYFKKLINRKYYKYIIANSDKNFANTHIISEKSYTNVRPRQFKYNIETISPQVELAKFNKLCNYNIILSNNISFKGNLLLQNYTSNIINHSLENNYSFDNLSNNNILNNQADYYCHIKNANVIITEPNPLFLSDCAYNNKHCYILCDNIFPIEDFLMASINNSFNYSSFINDKLLRNFNKKQKNFKLNKKNSIHHKIKEIL